MRCLVIGDMRVDFSVSNSPSRAVSHAVRDAHDSAAVRRGDTMPNEWDAWRAQRAPELFEHEVSHHD